MAKEGGNFVAEGAALQGGTEAGFIHGAGVFAREPMVALAEEVVSHFAPLDQIERMGIGPEAEDFQDVDLAGNIEVFGQALKPGTAPVGPDTRSISARSRRSMGAAVSAARW